MKIVVCASGRFHSVHLAKQLKRRGLLHHFCSAGLTKADLKILPSRTTSFCLPVNFLDRVYVKLSGDRFISPSRWYTMRDGWFDTWSASQIKNRPNFDLFVGWANCSLKSIKVLKPRGTKIVIESGSMHITIQEQILRDEYEKWGAYFSPVVKANKDKMLEEYELADKICVPSSHVAKSFIDQGVSSSKLIKVPYGIDFSKFGQVKKQTNNKFRVIFVGQISLQKGIAYLLKAWENLKFSPNQAELVLVGNVSIECKKMVNDAAGQDQSIKLVGSVRHDELSGLYARASAFVLPSIQEGLAMVIGEAMASSLPVICTTMTGGLELIEDGKQGFVVNPRDPEVLADKILHLYKNPDIAKEMGMQARTTAKQKSWENYADFLVGEYEQLLGRR